jgi:RND family efflux transporter MFP subunit
MNRNFFVTMLIIPAIFFSCGNDKKESKNQGIKSVKYSVIEQAGGIRERTYPGITQSSSLTNLSFRSGGLLVQLNVKVGMRVKKGNLLARLDQKDVKLAYDQALADVQNAKAQYDAASSGFERAKKLYETNNASLTDYEAAKSSYSNAQSSYEISLKRLDLQKSQIDYTEIISPMDGIISGVESEINEVIQPGRTIIVMSRENENDMEVQVGIPESYINEIQNGDEVDIKIGSIDNTFSGVVTEVAYSSSGTGVTYPVTVSLDTKGNRSVRPDMPAEVTIRFGSSDQQSFLVAPLKAIASGVDGNYVYRLLADKEDGIYIAKKVNVELGTITKNGYIIREGLKEGDLVAVAGLRSLYEGRKVKLLEE